MGKVDPPFAVAGEVSTWRLTFEPGRQIKAGQTLVLEVSGGRHNKGPFESLQVGEPSKLDYVTARLADGTTLPLSPAKRKGSVFQVGVPEQGFPAGEKILVTIGDTSGGGAGAIAPSLRMFNKYIALHCPELAKTSRPGHDPRDQTADHTMIGACLMHIIGSEIEHLRAYVPSQCRPGEEVDVLIRPEDRFSNLSSQNIKEVTVFLGEEKLPVSLQQVERSTCVRARVRIPIEGVHRLRVVDGRSGKECMTNPTRCLAKLDGYNVYWGVIHGHTEMSDGCGTLDNYYRQMRDECALDFGSSSDHDHLYETSDEHWKLVCRAAGRWNEPGRFVSFLGYEWAKWRRNGDGDRNVYYPGDDQPMFRSDNGFHPRPSDLFRALAGRKAIVIPHHPAGDGNFCDYKDHDPEHERLIEIHQMRGCYECPEEMGNPLIAKPDRPGGKLMAGCFVSDALALGWRVGFTAGGDDHFGTAGTERPVREQDGKAITAGMMAVLAKERTREAIWDALWNRRVIATSGPRMLLHVELNGHPVGSELKAAVEPELKQNRRVRVRFIGTEPVQRIDVIRNNKVAYTTDQAEFIWEDNSPLADVLMAPAKFREHPFCFYYVRAVQADGQAAWASPIWVDP
ncbi:MAG TPA: DUF3604 domain-containing protein [Phycisphaerae bacterium]|nr:DUF3604 domain-containing protein [Phycisphaerae bacterium]